MTAGSVRPPTIMPLRAPIPGQHKSAIDTDTKIELRSETPGATVYYTISGQKPEPFNSISPAGKNTFKYRQPFRLPSGKKTIKAVAVSEDGMRESHVVSKTFDVDQLDQDHLSPQEDGLDFVNDIPAEMLARKEVKKFAHKMVTSKEAWQEVQRMKQSDGSGSSRRRPTSATNRSGAGLHTSNGFTLNGMLEGKSRMQPPDTATQAMRLQRETDFLKCIYCFAPRPADPYARFCGECGNNIPPLPQTRMAPPEPGQLGTCVHCKSMVPFNAPTCVICEAPLSPQNIPQAKLKVGEKRICGTCGTINPGNITSCITCETRLTGMPQPVATRGQSAPPLPDPSVDNGRRLTCSKCGRVNMGDARFCDWCGAKPSAPSTSLTCSKCRASNQPYSKFCGTCGVIIEPPQRPEVRSGGVTVTLNPEFGGKNATTQWIPVAITGKPVPAASVATQTVGLFYPSQREINKRHAEEEEKIAMEKMMRDRKPLLTAVSPGRGYWRKQIEHICTHIKAHAQNNAEFRALIGEPRMGKIISTGVHEDGYELSMTVNFALRGNKDPLVGEKLNYSQREYLSTYTEGRKSSLTRYGSQESLVSGTSTARSGKGKGKRKVTKKVVRKNNKNEDKLTDEDKKLLKEIGKNGEGLPSEVQQLIEEGADPCCVNKDGYPALIVAVLNKHVDAIPILVQEGAEINVKGPNKGNTALHESVSLGKPGLEVIDALLDCGASTQKKNDKGETAYDLAIKAGEEEVGSRLAANLGQTALDKLIKPKGGDDDDVF